jgi:hypothetical protein
MRKVMDKIHPSERMNGWEGSLEVIKTREKQTGV